MEKIDGFQVKLNSAKPTMISQKQLNDWVIWQFPKKVAEGLCGAVHPPSLNFGWLPAVIFRDKNELLLYANVPETFDSPESAAEFCLANGRS